MKKFVLAYFLLFLISAHSASAAVVFNEIAWMGSTVSSADEWIELYNDGTSTEDMTAWKIVGKGNAQIVLLRGSIAPDEYFLIERSDDNTVPNVEASLVASFGKGLSNDGETLKLLDGAGTVVDTVVGGKNWTKIGGDKVSKATAQRTPTGWITAAATPKAPNATPSLAKDVATPVKAIQTSKSVHTLPEKVVAVSSEPQPLPELVAQTTTPLQVGVGTATVLWQSTPDKGAATHTEAWMLFALLLVIVACIVLVRAYRHTPSEAESYRIIEDAEGDDAEDRLSDF